MAQRQNTRDYRSIFLSGAPLLDLRAPAEFSQGAFPNAISEPLMTDEERAQVGICYKQSGQQAAIDLGHQLVCGATREVRLARWLDFAREHADGYLYCFRGGLRSQTVQHWLRDAGIDYPLVLGGYKAMRRFLLDELQQSISRVQPVLIAGRTGTGKTRVIEALADAIDLEGLAQHRGSAFGHLVKPQPSQIDFENALSIDLLRQLATQKKRVFLEDEGRLIGRLSLPEALREAMARAPMLVVEESLASRVDAVIEDYILDLGERFAAEHGEAGPLQHCARLLNDLHRIRKRLGGLRYQEVKAMMEAAFHHQWSEGALDGHRAWIEVLLSDYYDPMYEYQLGKRQGAVLFSGPREAVVRFATGMT
ncbi:MAG: tRNA 2-selenouridine(34) synthase MnmH [Pseudomonadota bacterium]